MCEVFDLCFLGLDPEPQDGDPECGEPDWHALRGRIVLGEFEEEFLAALGPWTQRHYERQWMQAARRVVEQGHNHTGFFTSAFQFFWTAWLEGEILIFQQKLLLEDTLLAPFDPADPYPQVGERTTESDGDRISEWRVSLTDVKEFVSRHARAYDAA